jgi:glycosyltransferase involved in cell wall biosynthesis
MSKSKVGVGIITCNRVDYLKTLLNSLIPCEDQIDELVVVNDGDPANSLDLSHKHSAWLDNLANIGVGKSKNKAMKHLLERGCDYIFIIEDDMVILDPTVFNKYIEAHKKSGIHHFNYGPGSPFNRKQTIQNFDLHNRHLLDQKSEPNPRLIVEYSEEVRIALYEHTVGMFSFFTKTLLEQNIGYMNEDYDQCWEHVCSTYDIIKAGYHPPFWWFADLANSHELITEAPGAIENSAIAKDRSEWMKKVMAGREIYKSKHGHYPNEAPLTTKEEVIRKIKQLKDDTCR